MSNPVTIYHICPYYPPHVGGLQTAVYNLATAQIEEEKNVTVMTSNFPKTFLQNTDKPNVIRLTTIEFAHTPFIVNLLPNMLKRIKSHDVIHLHYAQLYVPEVVALYHLITRRPFIFHFHGDVLPSGRFGFLLKPYKKYILPFSLRQAAVIVFPSTDFKHRVLQSYPFLNSKMIKVIPNGIFLPSGLSRRNKKLNYFIYVGRLADIKNVPFIIESFHIARQQITGLKLLIVGDGELKDNLIELVDSLGESSSIQFVGELPFSDIAALYKNAYALLVASERESFGMGIIEAMAYGVPVIACRARGVSKIVHNNVNGYLCKRLNDVYASCLVNLVKQIKLQERFARSARITAEQYSISNAMHQFDDLYKEIL